jgi:hypothetical protein
MYACSSSHARATSGNRWVIRHVDIITTTQERGGELDGRDLLPDRVLPKPIDSRQLCEPLRQSGEREPLAIEQAG